ncbi:MAG: copper-binding protein [Acidobacteria bacterium]|nr:copper-binding protein [Acidobacteriota bacterium]MBS1866052.1 copper-binding protein [Acidobacteriota bacterium]
MKSRRFILFCLIALTIWGCGQVSQPSQRYHMQGEVLAVDVPGNAIYIKHDDIPGYMKAMSMGYAVRNPSEIAPLHAGDKIQADVVVEKGVALLEKVRVTERAAANPAAPSDKR